MSSSKSYMMTMPDPTLGQTPAEPNPERRPPLYKAEDYVSSLRRFCKLTGLQMYLQDPQGSQTTLSSADSAADFVSSNNRKNSKSALSGGKFKLPSEEMRERSSDELGIRQFGTVTELLAKLKVRNF